MKQKKIIAYSSGTLVLITAIIIMVNQPATLVSGAVTTEIKSDKFLVIHPAVVDTAFIKEYVADIQAMQHVGLRAKVSGYIDAIHVEEGQFVKQGQLLFSINAREHETDLAKASASLQSAIAEAKVAEVEVGRVETLVSKNIVSQSELALAQAQWEGMKAHVEEMRYEESNARLRLSYCKITAPFDGAIDRIPNKVGSLVEEGELLTTISDNAKVYAYFNVSEKEYLEIVGSMNRGDQPVSFIMANQKPYPYKGKIESVDNKINRETGNIAFRATFSNPDHLLRHGASGKICVRNAIDNALIIPQQTVFDAQDKSYVYAVNEDNLVQRKQVTMKMSMTNIYVVESGLAPTDRLIYEGIQLVKVGQPVDVEMHAFLTGKTEDSPLAMAIR